VVYVVSISNTRPLKLEVNSMQPLSTIMITFLISITLSYLLYGFPLSSLSACKDKKIIPYTGGIAIFTSFCMGWLFNSCSYGFLFLCICFSVFVIGLIDDALTFLWHQKLALQLVIGLWVIMVLGGFDWTGTWLDDVISVLWVVGLMNSFNLVDNMDGLCGGVGVIVCIFGALITGDMSWLVLGAAIGGFLVWNLRGFLWMGDSGSMLIGFIITMMLIKEVREPVPCILMVGLPILDTTYVTVKRIWKGGRPWRGGTDHLSHMLVSWGFTKHTAVEILCLVAGGMCWLAWIT